MSAKSVWVYHEKQVGSLCGVHCLNSLFQAPVYNEVELSQMGFELDEKERMLMMELGETRDFLKYMSEDSGNVSDDGNFSIQVLQKALASKSLDCTLMTPNTFSTVFSTLNKQNAFICNKGSHWYTIRRIGNDWYNLNSLEEKPVFIPELILAGELQALVKKGNAIYLIQGTLPPASLERSTTVDGKWIRVKGDEESDLEEALRLSALQEKQKQTEREKIRQFEQREQAFLREQQLKNQFVGNQAPQPSHQQTPFYQPQVPSGAPITIEPLSPNADPLLLQMDHFFNDCMGKMKHLNSRLTKVENNLMRIRTNARTQKKETK